MLRRHPQGVRAVVLDSLTPPDVDALAEEGPSLERALGKAFAECAATPTCQTRSPDPAAALAEVVARLQADPVEASSHGGSVTLDGRTFVQAVAALLRDGHPADDLVKRIEEARAGDYSFVAAVLTSPRTPGAVGAFLSVACAEQMAGDLDRGHRAAAMALSPAVRGALTSRFVALACPPWAVPGGARTGAHARDQRAAVLLLAGDRDPDHAPGLRPQGRHDPARRPRAGVPAAGPPAAAPALRRRRRRRPSWTTPPRSRARRIAGSRRRRVRGSAAIAETLTLTLSRCAGRGQTLGGDWGRGSEEALRTQPIVRPRPPQAGEGRGGRRHPT